MFKNTYYLILALFILIPKISFLQSIVTAVDGSSQSDCAFNLLYKYSLSQTIYTQSQISLAGNITKIYFEYDGYSIANRDLTIYFGHTNKSSFANTNDWIPNSSLTQVSRFRSV